MTKEEAIRILNLKDGDDVWDKWDELFFEFKQFFIGKPLIQKLLHGRVKKLQKASAAFYVLVGLAPGNSGDRELPEFAPKENVLDAFHAYQRFRMQVKHAILSASSSAELISLLNAALEQEEKWWTLWVNQAVAISEGEMVVSKEPDPMDLLAELKVWNESSNSGTFNALHSELSFLSEPLLHEVKRLTLLFQKYRNGGCF